MPFRPPLGKPCVLLDVPGAELATVVVEVLDRGVRAGVVPAAQRAEIEHALLAREVESPSVIGHGVVVPHLRVEGLEATRIFFVRLARPINAGAPDGVAIGFMVLLLVRPEDTARHLETLTATARLMSDPAFRRAAFEAASPDDVLAAYEQFLLRFEGPSRREKPPPSEALRFTGRLAGGLRDDLRRRVPFYGADLRDGLHPRVLASVLFLFFACLAPAVAFGGLMAVMTEGQIGAVEMLVATAGCGVLYALLAGQPLTILGGTGPLLVFTGMLYGLCRTLGVAFLPTYAWVGIWTSFFLVVLAVTDGSALIRYFTRFTDEVFAALIAVIFIYEALADLARAFTDPHTSHATALLSLVLALGTFYLAGQLSRMRRSVYLRPRVREFLADFGPTIAIGAMAVVAALFHAVDLATLQVPASVATTSGRPWRVDLGAVPMWVAFAAAVPALLGTVLVFLDQNITSRLVNSAGHRLVRGPAYHLDLLVMAVLLGVCSLFGLPWLVAATVRSLNHVRSLATLESVVAPGGEHAQRVTGVLENRVSAFMIHALIGVSLGFLGLLHRIPMAVLFGLFLHMGVASTGGNQLFERMKLWIRDPALYPRTHYLRRVPVTAVHAYTAIQTGCLALLWVVKSSSLGILFPLFVALLAPVRALAPRLLGAAHVDALDTEEEPDEEVSRDAE